MIAAAILRRVRPYIINVTGKGGQWLMASGVVTLATGFSATIGYCASLVPVEGVRLAVLAAGLGLLVDCRSSFLYSVIDRGYLKSAGLILLHWPLDLAPLLDATSFQCPLEQCWEGYLELG